MAEEEEGNRMACQHGQTALAARLLKAADSDTGLGGDNFRVRVLTQFDLASQLQYGLIAAAEILCSLGGRNLKRWPDWLQPPSTEEAEEAVVEPPPPPLPELQWPKRQRANVRSKAANVWPVSLESLFASMGSGAPCGREDDGPAPAKRQPSGGDVDECVSPAKRARVDGDPAGQQATSPAADEAEEPEKTRSRSDDNRDEKGCLLFDLNEDAPCEEV